jgi:serine/threonine-protein kinase RsbT
MAVLVQRDETLQLRSDMDIVRVRQVARTWAVELGFNLVDQTKLVTAASELARNTVDWGGGGAVWVEVLDDGGRQGLRLTFEDHGPGIPDIELALKDGYSTGSGLGLGLGGARRLVNEFQIVSRVGEGTRVTITMWKRGA